MRVALTVDRDVIRAIGVRGTRVRWTAEAAVSSPDDLGRGLGELLPRLPRSRWIRPSLLVGIGPWASQVKRLERLPSLANSKLYAALVAENAGRFFLRNGAPVVTGAVVRDPDGALWAAAFDEPVVEAVVAAARASRFRIRTIVPTVAALGHLVGNGVLVYGDGATRWRARYAARHLVELARAPEPSMPLDAPDVALAPPPGLAENGARFAMAYALASADLGVLPGVNLRRHRSFAARVPTWRAGVAVAAILIAACAALVAPILAARRSERAARAALAAMQADGREIANQVRELTQFTTALEDVGRFSAAVQPVSRLIAEAERALPQNAAVVTLRVDSATVALVLLAPRAVQALTALDHVPGAVNPQILGPLTHEAVAGQELERVTIRFRYQPWTPP